MIILTTLKQKDLAAVSAQQLLLQKGYQENYQPSQIEKFQFYTINGDFKLADALHAIHNSYIFSNPNKHHLITTPNKFINDHYLYFNIYRKEPLNLNSKVIQLNKLLPETQSVNSINVSDLWAFKYSQSDLFSKEFIEVVTNQFIISSPSNNAPFSHPVIHNVAPLTYSQLTQQFDAA